MRLAVIIFVGYFFIGIGLSSSDFEDPSVTCCDPDCSYKCEGKIP